MPFARSEPDRRQQSQAYCRRRRRQRCQHGPSRARCCPTLWPPQNIMAWLVAGGLAYYLWVVPARQRDDEQHRVREQVRAGICGAENRLS